MTVVILLSILAFLVVSCEEPANYFVGDDEGVGLVTSPNEGFTKAVVRVGIMGDSVSTFGGELVNNSFAGTKVVRGSYSGLSGASYKAGFVDRVGGFYHPDVIIIYGGINDCIKNAPDADLTPHWRTDIPAPDWTHPNDVGHAFIAQKVYDTCKDYLI